MKNFTSKVPRLFMQTITRKVVVLMFFLCSISISVWADELRDAAIRATGIDEYGAYVEIYLPVSNVQGINRWIDDGNLYVNGIRVAWYRSARDEDRTILFNPLYNFGARARGADGNDNDWSGFITPGQSITVQDGRSGDVAETLVRWYVPQALLGVELNFSVIGHIDGNSGAGVGYRGDFNYSLGSRTVNSPIINATLTSDVSPASGKMRVSYRYSGSMGGNFTNNTTSHWLTYPGTTTPKVTDNTNSNASGSIDIDYSNTARTVTFNTEFAGRDRRCVYTRTNEIVKVNAYQWPDAFSTSYDDSSGIVKLSWSIANLTANDIVKGDEFELQRSLDPAFPSTTTKTFSVPFDGGTVSGGNLTYIINDNMVSDNVQGTVYYRLRRTKTKADWGWGILRATNLQVSTKLLQPVDKGIAVRLDESGSSPKVLLNWGIINGVWPTGSQFIIRREAGTNTSDIVLSDADLRAGIYEDFNINTCVEYKYSLLVRPGSPYATTPVIALKGKAILYEIGSIRDLQASKGYYSDRVELQWYSKGGFTQFLVYRSATGNFSGAVQIGSVPAVSTAGSTMLYEDTRPLAGTYYTYYIRGVKECGGDNSTTDSLVAVGFRAPTGNVYGRVTYENGQAVENVAVRLQNNGGVLPGRSIFLNGNPNSYLTLDSLYTPLSDTAFSMEVWIKPSDIAPANQVLFSRGGQYEVGFDGAGKLYFTAYNNTVTGTYKNTTQAFVHLATVFHHNELSLYLNGEKIGSKAGLITPTGNPDAQLYIGKNSMGNNYKGYIDEIRLWNKGITEEALQVNHTRLLVGNEPGIIAYWRFDETINNQFFDISQQNGVYNRNDGKMNATEVSRSATIPTADQLSLKGITDQSGNYMVSGIPYTDNGITYTIIPTLGTHQFDPTSVNRLISASSNEFTVDFKDKSSFPVSGTIYYSNSTIPVKGVQFQIDDQYAHQANGQIIESDDFGKFTINVPVGTHEVKAVKLHHNFENGGKITDRFGANLNYQGPISERVLYDETKVRFIGRVAGGSVQDSIVLGHSLSKNNLGEKLSVFIALAGAQNRKINASETNVDSVVAVNHYLPKYNSAVQHSTTVHYKPYEIEILPDPVTGEFFVDLIPENYNITSVKASGHPDLVGSSQLNLDLTDKFSIEKEVRSYIDTVTLNGSTITSSKVDTVSYNSKYKFIYRNNPTITLSQVNNNNQTLNYLGDTAIDINLLNGTKQAVRIFSDDNYTFGYPVFSQNTNYAFKIKAFEAYNYYLDNNQNPVSVDIVPTTDGIISILNDLRDGDISADTLSLNQDGEGVYSFIAGTPELNDGIGLKGFSMSVKFGTRVFNWNNGNNQPAYIIGGRKTGSDFVTAGPQKILTVIRDPGGSNSSAFFAEGSSFSSTNEYTGVAMYSSDNSLIQYLGAAVKTATGIGFTVATETEVNNTIGGHIIHEETVTGSHTTEEKTTFQTTYSTSDDPFYVGAKGDLFVGNSTNISYGSTLNLSIVKNEEVQPNSDIVLLNGQDVSLGYSLVVRRGIDFAQRFATHFMYSQHHITTILIPNLVSGRNSLLLPLGTSDADAQMRANTLKQTVYVSKLTADDPNFGMTNDDEVFGDPAMYAGKFDGPSYKVFSQNDNFSNVSDTIMIINQHIAQWKTALYDNEKKKVEATKLLKNYSFTGASKVEVTEETNISTTKSGGFSILVGAGLLIEAGALFNKTGVKVTVDEKFTTTHSGNFGSNTETTKSFGFTLAETGTDYLSIDVFQDADNNYVFKTKGGVTECPYEGASVTEFYEPGKHILSQPTIQAQVPSITVDQAVVANIPSSRRASYVVHLSNNTDNANSLGAGFLIHLGDDTNPDGAKMYMDGTELGAGREIFVPYGSTMTKTITLEKGPNVMSHENLQLILESPCQWQIADTVSLAAHFIPSCSDVNIKSPTDKWIINTSSPVDNNKNPYLPINIDNFDVNTSLFDHIVLEYKPFASSVWTTAMQFYHDTLKYNAAEGEKMMLSENGVINYNLVMNAFAFADQNYEIRAVSYCIQNGQVIAITASNIISGIKDTYNPRLFGNPQPANGILGIEDDVRINFNEPVADGLLSPADFQVTGIRNGALSDHSVAVKLDGQGEFLTTELKKNLADKNITVETWALSDRAANGTLFSQGASNESLELAITSDNFLEITVGQKVIRSSSRVAYKAGEWAHIAMVLNATTNTVSAYYNFQELIHEAPVPPYNGNGVIQIGRSIQKNGNFFGGKLHELRIWSDVITSLKLQQNSRARLSGDESGLLAYYPMTEGKGNVVGDKARGVNAILNGEWSMAPGKAVAFNGNSYLELNTSYAPILKEMDYTIELWFKGTTGQANAGLLSTGKGDGHDLDTANVFFLGFENGQLTFKNNGQTVIADGNYLDNSWHHVAVAVNRNSGNGQLLVDGLLKKNFDTQGLGGIQAAKTTLGARAYYTMVDESAQFTMDNYFRGNIDEVRIWNTYLSQAIIAENNNTGLRGDEFGLMAYYPFNTYFTFQNNQEMGYTLKDMKIQEVANVTVPDAIPHAVVESDETAPVKTRGPIENLQFNYVVNNDGIIINLLEPRQAVDKTIVTFKAKNIRDKNGNTILSPITWTAYIDKNPMKWSDDELNFSKDVYAPLDFEVQIVNRGGNMQNFRLQHLPNWLTASPSSGTINPKGTQKIQFKVNKGLNVGAYDEVIYMLNDNQESEALVLNLQVRGPKPDWNVHPANYKYSMTVYGKIKTEGVFSTNPEDLLGAFVNGKCVGVTTNAYFQSSDNWYTLLTVYNDSIKQDKIEYRIWDAATGKIYLATPDQPAPFVNDQIYGTARNPIIFEGLEMQFQNITLNKGWNWISFPLNNPSLGSVPAMLTNGTWGSGDIVKNEEFGFNSYSTAIGWVGSLQGFNNTSLYMLNTSNAQVLSTMGTKTDIAATPIPVKGGRWNYISFLPLVNVSIKEALADYQASDDDVIKSQTGFAMYDSRNGWVGTLNYLEPGKGYMLYRKATTNTSFVYPTITGILTNYLQNAATMGQAIVSNNYVYAENMTMSTVIANSFDLQPGDKVRAYMNGELRGEAAAVVHPQREKPTLLINIAGDAMQAVRFAVERNEKIVAYADQVLSYTANSNVGTIRTPYVLTFNNENPQANDKIYPNPFREKVRIDLNLKGEQTAEPKQIQMNVFDMSGKLVYAGASVSTPLNSYTLTWDGRNNTGGISPKGVYMMNVKVNDKSRIYKITKF